MGTCPYCGKEVESGKFICESCSDSSSNPVIAVGSNFSLSSTPDNSLSESIASQAILAPESPSTEQILESPKLEPEFDASKSFAPSDFSKSAEPTPVVKSEKVPYQVVEKPAPVSTEPVKTLETPSEKNKPKPVTYEKPESKVKKIKKKSASVEFKKTESKSKSTSGKKKNKGVAAPKKTSSNKKTKQKPIQKSSKNTTTVQQFPRSSKSSQESLYDLELFPKEPEKPSKLDTSNYYQSNSNIEEKNTYYTQAQKQYYEEVNQSPGASYSKNYTNAQMEFINDSVVEQRLAALSSKERSKIKLHSDFQILNAGSGSNKTIAAFFVFAGVVFMLPFMTSGLMGFVFSMVILALIYALAKGVIDSLVNTDWNLYASWVYRHSKSQIENFRISFIGSYLVDKLYVLGEDNDSTQILKVRKHTKDFDKIQNLHKTFRTAGKVQGRLYKLEGEDPVVCIVELEDIRFWCEPG